MRKPVNSFALAVTPVKINPSELTSDAARYFIHELTEGCETLLEAGSGTGAIALDFAINGGKRICMIDRNREHYEASYYNAVLSKVPDENFEAHHCSVGDFAQTNTTKYDCIVVGSVWITSDEIGALIRSSLNEGGRVIGIIREDVVNQVSAFQLKEVAKLCNMRHIEPFIDPMTGVMRLIYYATHDKKDASDTSGVLTASAIEH